MRPRDESKRSACEPGVLWHVSEMFYPRDGDLTYVAKGGNSSALLVFKELQVKESAPSLWEPTEDLVPAALPFVALLMSVNDRSRS